MARMLTGQAWMDVVKSCGIMQNENLDHSAMLAPLHKPLLIPFYQKVIYSKGLHNDS